MHDTQKRKRKALLEDDDDASSFWDEEDADFPEDAKQVHHVWLYDDHECHVYFPRQNQHQRLNVTHDCRRKSFLAATS